MYNHGCLILSGCPLGLFQDDILRIPRFEKQAFLFLYYVLELRFDNNNKADMMKKA